MSCGGTVLKLGAATFAYYAWLAERRIKHGDDGGVSSLETSPKEMHRGLTETFGLTERSRDALRSYIDLGRIPEEAMQTRKNRVNDALTRALGQDDTPYHIASLGYIAGTQFERQGLRLGPHQIAFEPLSMVTDETED